jgi:hypothetical protein
MGVLSCRRLRDAAGRDGSHRAKASAPRARCVAMALASPTSERQTWVPGPAVFVLERCGRLGHDRVVCRGPGGLGWAGVAPRCRGRHRGAGHHPGRGMGIVHGKQRHIPWSQVAGVCVYVLSWEATGSSPPTGGSNPVFHVHLADGGAVRAFTTGARFDSARVAPAVRQFAPQVPMTDLGCIFAGDDPLRGPGDLAVMTEPEFGWLDRLHCAACPRVTSPARGRPSPACSIIDGSPSGAIHHPCRVRLGGRSSWGAMPPRV